MYKKLIAFKVKGIKELGNFSINLVATDQKSEDEKFYNLIQAFPSNDNIYLNKSLFINGRNASGKTSLLKLLKSIDSFSDPTRQQGINSQNVLFSFFGEVNSVIEVEAYYSASDFIFKHEIKFTIFKNQNWTSGDESIYSVKIISEDFSHVLVSPKASTKSVVELFDNKAKWEENKLSGFNELNGLYKVEFSEKIRPVNTQIFSSNYSQFPDYMLNVIFVDEFKNKFFDNFEELIKDLSIDKPRNRFKDEVEEVLVKSEKIVTSVSRYITSNHITNESFFQLAINNEFYVPFIKVFDTNVEEIRLINNTIWNVKLKGRDTIMISDKLEDILSTGTIRGIEIFSMIMFTFKYGGDIYVDEIEQNFNHKIVSFIYEILNDPKLNSESRLIVSTHYPKTLDYTSRRDGVYFTEIVNNKLKYQKLSEITDVKKIISKRVEYPNSRLTSKIFSLDINPGIVELNKTKRLIKEKLGELDVFKK